MPTYQYVGALTDIGLGVLTSQRPVVRVRLEEEAISAEGLVSAVPVPVELDGNSRFVMNLIPSGALVGAVSHRAGVDYVVEVGRFEDDIRGKRFHGTDVYRFTAAADGGNIGSMVGGSLLAVWVGPPWPSQPSPRGLYIDNAPPNDWGVRS